jgi:molecular chaperone GrpE
MERTEQQADMASEQQSDNANPAEAMDAGAEGILENQISELESALAEAQAEAERQREGALRTRAEFDNLQKRLERDLDKSRRFALEKILGDLLPVIDSLGASLGSEQATQEQLREGAELTLKMMSKLISDHGLKEIDPLHEAFDPELHQAMSMQPSEEHAPNTVVQVFQKGYQLHERLLRPALVVVAKAAD